MKIWLRLPANIEGAGATPANQLHALAAIEKFKMLLIMIKS